MHLTLGYIIYDTWYLYASYLRVSVDALYVSYDYNMFSCLFKRINNFVA